MRGTSLSAGSARGHRAILMLRRPLLQSKRGAPERLLVAVPGASGDHGDHVPFFSDCNPETALAPYHTIVGVEPPVDSRGDYNTWSLEKRATYMTKRLRLHFPDTQEITFLSYSAGAVLAAIMAAKCRQERLVVRVVIVDGFSPALNSTTDNAQLYELVRNYIGFLLSRLGGVEEETRRDVMDGTFNACYHTVAGARSVKPKEEVHSVFGPALALVEDLLSTTKDEKASPDRWTPARVRHALLHAASYLPKVYDLGTDFPLDGGTFQSLVQQINDFHVISTPGTLEAAVRNTSLGWTSHFEAALVYQVKDDVKHVNYMAGDAAFFPPLHRILGLDVPVKPLPSEADDLHGTLSTRPRTPAEGLLCPSTSRFGTVLPVSVMLRAGQTFDEVRPFNGTKTLTTLQLGNVGLDYGTFSLARPPCYSNVLKDYVHVLWHPSHDGKMPQRLGADRSKPQPKLCFARGTVRTAPFKVRWEGNAGRDGRHLPYYTLQTTLGSGEEVSRWALHVSNEGILSLKHPNDPGCCLFLSPNAGSYRRQVRAGSESSGSDASSASPLHSADSSPSRSRRRLLLGRRRSHSDSSGSPSPTAMASRGATLDACLPPMAVPPPASRAPADQAGGGRPNRSLGLTGPEDGGGAGGGSAGHG